MNYLIYRKSSDLKKTIILKKIVISIAINRLYFVHISGLWCSSSLSHNHCPSSYTPLPKAARQKFRLLQRATTVTFSYTHSAGAIRTESANYNKKKEKENTLLPRSLAYKKIKDKTYPTPTRDISNHYS
jgi:hypothetical protein